jgi:hypothetical protein
MKPVLLLQLAGLTYIGLLCAGALMPRIVDLRGHLAPLPPFIRRLVWVYFAFIGVTLLGGGAVSFFMAESLAAGTPLARALCTFLGLFWALRWIVAVFVFDVRPYLTNRWLTTGYQATNIVFTLLPLLYGWVALRGGAP